MSYGFPDETKKRRGGGGGGFFFLILLAFGAVFLMRSMNGGGAPPADQRGGDIDRSGRFDPLEDVASDDRFDPPPERSADSGDWDMESVEVKNNPANRDNRRTTSNDKTNAGDWSMEQVPANEKQSDPNFKFSNEQTPEAPKSTESGDWSTEEIPVTGGGGM